MRKVGFVPCITHVRGGASRGHLPAGGTSRARCMVCLGQSGKCWTCQQTVLTASRGRRTAGGVWQCLALIGSRDGEQFSLRVWLARVADQRLDHLARM